MSTAAEAMEQMQATPGDSLNAVRAALANAEGRDEASKHHGHQGEPFVCATVGLRISDLKAVLATVAEVERLRVELATSRATEDQWGRDAASYKLHADASAVIAEMWERKWKEARTAEMAASAEIETLRDQGAEAFDAYSAAYDSVSDELRVVTRERDDARRNLSTSRTTCAYCEAVHELPCTFESIREHIEACPKHPLAAARAAIFEAIDRHQVASARANKLEQERDELLAAVRSLLPLAEACARSRERLDMPLGAVEARETVSAAEALLAREGP